LIDDPETTAAPMEERQRDADRSQGLILAAARDEFAEYGLRRRPRMDRIAERAGVDKRLIYYYFSRQETLCSRRCWNRAYRDIRAAERELQTA
jgi:AcrR family transcriptional regulator